jgi:hypothetical protein
MILLPLQLRRHILNTAKVPGILPATPAPAGSRIQNMQRHAWPVNKLENPRRSYAGLDTWFVMDLF